MRGIALSGQRVPKPEALVCQVCRLFAPPVARYRPQSRSYASTTKATRRPQIGQCLSKRTVKPLSVTRLPMRRYESTESKAPESNPSEPTASESKTPESEEPALPDLTAILRDIQSGTAELRNSKTVPSDEAVLKLLEKCLGAAETIVRPELASGEQGNEISSLLDLDEKDSKKPSKPRNAEMSHPSADTLCSYVHELLTDEKIFISPEALAYYVTIHAGLKRPQSFPEIFHLYANKPIPEKDSSPIKYLSPKPKKIKSAVPVELANLALDAAVEQRDLSLVLSIIDHTFCAPAFYRAKFFTKAAAPLGILAATPLGCYALASFAATFQNTMEPSTATAMAFAASLTYVAGTSSIGLLSIITANDHMERVVWIPGVPLRERWMREEERAALDRVALAWGFKNIDMRGEEEGEEWDSLRELIGIRGMILDKTDLMEGMQ